MKSLSYMQHMHDRIDPVHVPFSDRGSRLLLYSYGDRSAFYLKLAERLEKLQPGLETHRSRSPFLSDIELLDGEGQKLKFKLETYPHVIRCYSPIGQFEITYSDHDTLAVGLPAGMSAGVSLVISDLFDNQRTIPGDLVNSRRVELRSNLAVRQEETITVQNGHRKRLIVEAGEGGSILIGILRGDNAIKETKPFSEILTSARSRWDEWFELVPEVEHSAAPAYTYAWWTLANNLVAPLGHIRHEAVMPSKAQYFGIWNWDACFHAIGLRHLDAELARNQLRTILAEQCEDGMIPDVVHDEGIVDRIEHPVAARVTKPPVIAWAALKIFEIDADTKFLQEIYPALVRWNRWWFEERGSEIDGLAEYQHPYSSGLDDSPLWDHGFPVVAPDLNTYLVLQMDSLATIAEILGDPEGARSWRRRAETTVASMITELFDPDEGLFWALHDGKPIPEITPFNLYPLWTNRLPEEIEVRLLDHLADPEFFWRKFPLSTVAQRTRSYDPETMWRGPVWININYIFHEALRNIGRDELAQQLRDRTIELISCNEGVREYYNPETGIPPADAARIFSWSAALFADLVLYPASD